MGASCTVSVWTGTPSPPSSTLCDLEGVMRRPVALVHLDGVTDLDFLLHPWEHGAKVEALVGDRRLVELDRLVEPLELGQQLGGDLDVQLLGRQSHSIDSGCGLQIAAPLRQWQRRDGRRVEPRRPEEQRAVIVIRRGIGIPRLIARPTATLSLEAQQRRELKQKMFGD